MARPLHQIAEEIRREWIRPYFAAEPYLAAMGEVTHISDRYGADSARSVVLYFLCNAKTWRGPAARRIKQELKQILSETK